MDDGSATFERDTKGLRRSFKFFKDEAGTIVYAVAISNNPDLNRRIEIPAAYGSPVTHEVYNTMRDCIFLSGVDVHEVGFIPVSYHISLPDCDWDVCVPLPFAVIKRYMSKDQLASFNKWKSSFDGEKFTFQFVQEVSVF